MNKKRIAIFTLPLRNYNYGGILQAYALQTYLKDNFAAEVVILDYFFSRSNSLKSHISKQLFSGYHEFLDDVFVEFNKFISDNLVTSPTLKSFSKVCQYLKSQKWDVFIAGSDQIWRLEYAHTETKLYKITFLNFDGAFADIKRISYASSFGLDSWTYPELTSEISTYLEDFDRISVRESSGVDICRDIFNTDAEWLIDPTLLHPKEFYQKLVLKKAGCKLSETNDGQKRLFCYILDMNIRISKIIQQVALSTGNRLFLTELMDTVLSKVSKWNYKNYKDLKAESIEKWLLNFEESDFVITDSFHGVLFSIIFNVQFIAIGNIKRGLSRFESVLKLFKLEDRLLVDDQITSENILKLMKCPIDFDKVDYYRNQEVEKAFVFLKHSLEEYE